MGKWNGAHSRSRRIIIEPVRMETHASAAYGQHPQDIINGQLLKDSDFLIAIFGTKLGTPTINDLSGTLQEIREFAEQVAEQKGCKERVILAFRRPLNNEQIDERLTLFETEMRTKSLFNKFDNARDLETWLRHQLDITINHLVRDAAVNEMLGDEALMTQRQMLQLEKDRAEQELEIVRNKAKHESDMNFIKQNQKRMFDPPSGQDHY